MYPLWYTKLPSKCYGATDIVTCSKVIYFCVSCTVQHLYYFYRYSYGQCMAYSQLQLS